MRTLGRRTGKSTAVLSGQRILRPVREKPVSTALSCRAKRPPAFQQNCGRLNRSGKRKRSSSISLWSGRTGLRLPTSDRPTCKMHRFCSPLPQVTTRHVNVTRGLVVTHMFESSMRSIVFEPCSTVTLSGFCIYFSGISSVRPGMLSISTAFSLLLASSSSESAANPC